MYNILSVGKSGLNAVQNKMDAISDDIANTSTVAYKTKRMTFQELLVNKIEDTEVILSKNTDNPSISAGSKSVVGNINFHQGMLIPSSGEFHLAIEGEGFFGIRDENDNLMLTRNGAFHINENSTITNDSGLPVDINLEIPIDEWPNTDVSISSKGEITYQSDGTTVKLGEVILYTPENTDSLKSLGEGQYAPSLGVQLYNSNDNPEMMGKVYQYTLEASNVDTVQSMVEMIVMQNAYSANAKAIQTTDDIMSMINNIK